MKLLTLFPSNRRGGAEEYALTIACAAVTQGWQAHAAFSRRDETASLIRDSAASGVRLVWLGLTQALAEELKPALPILRRVRNLVR